MRTTLPGPRESSHHFDRKTAFVPAGLLGDGSTFPLADVLRQIGDHRRDAAGADFAPLHEFQPAELLGRLNVDGELPAAGRIEARANRVGVDRPFGPMRFTSGR